MLAPNRGYWQRTGVTHSEPDPKGENGLGVAVRPGNICPIQPHRRAGTTWEHGHGCRSPDLRSCVSDCNVNPPCFQRQLSQWKEGRKGKPLWCAWIRFGPSCQPPENRDKEQLQERNRKPPSREPRSCWLCPASPSVHLGKCFSLVEFPIYEVELHGADLFTKMGRFGKSRKENAIIITLQNL